MSLSLVHKIFGTVFLTGAGLLAAVAGWTSPSPWWLLLPLSSGALLAWHVRGPVRTLVQGARQLAQGQFATRLPVQTTDELGQLAVSFNQLAVTLQRSEESRKQWVADVSHELRTPLAVLRAEVEAIQDGVRAPDAEALQLLHEQVMTLTRLTEDLFQLARADVGQLQYKMQEVDLWKLLHDTVERFHSRYARARLELKLLRESSRLRSTVWADPDRLRQMLCNLLENSLRYTRAPGEVEVRCEQVGSHWIVRFDDTPPGVAPEKLPQLFDRFFRVEASRSKQLGGAGLGLALCRSIAEAHQADLRASPSNLGGLRVELRLPCYPK